MQTTIQTKIKQESAIEFLEDSSKYIGCLRGKLLKALIKGEKVNDLKSQYIIEHGLTARQFNSLYSEVKGLIKSSGELHQINIKASKERLSSLKRVIKSLTKKLEQCKQVQRVGKKSEKEALRWQLHHKKRKLDRLTVRIAKLKRKKASICLGGKKLFRAQFNLAKNEYANHRKWREAFAQKRNNRIFFIGSKDESFGNQNCQLLSNKLQVRVCPALQEKYGQYVNIFVEFKYGQEVVEQAIRKMQAINYRFVRKNKKWYLYLTTDIAPVAKVTKKKLGAIGVDLNKAHLAWAEIDRHGNLINYDTILTPIQDRSSHQVTATLADAVKQIVDRAKKQEKPVVIEKLDFGKKKNRFEEKHSGYRRMLSYFAYKKFHALIHSKASKEGVEIIEKNPAFSSIIGKYKFSLMYGISVHIAASLVLARRGLWFSERPPAKNARWLAEHRHRHVWTLWRLFVSAVSNRDKRVGLCPRRAPPSGACTGGTGSASHLVTGV